MEHAIACNRLDKSDKRMRMVIEKDGRRVRGRGEGWKRREKIHRNSFLFILNFTA